MTVCPLLVRVAVGIRLPPSIYLTLYKYSYHKVIQKSSEIDRGVGGQACNIAIWDKAQGKRHKAQGARAKIHGERDVVVFVAKLIFHSGHWLQVTGNKSQVLGCKKQQFGS
jgi:hypothetical protein